MCRLLFAKSNEKFEISDFLSKFALISKNSREYQGHGWGISYIKDGVWKHYKNIDPIWQSDHSGFGSTHLLLAHARSAFQDRDIKIENNMPFHDEKYSFIFNGELRGVKIKEQGRIGAEKIFNFIKRFDKGDIYSALKKGTRIISERSEYVKAMNIIISDGNKAYVSSLYNEQEDYFSLNFLDEENRIIICSDVLDIKGNWKSILNNSYEVFG